MTLDDRLRGLHPENNDGARTKPLRALKTGESFDTLPFVSLSELDAARYFSQEYGQDIRFCEAAGGWLIWDGKRWKPDNDGGIYRLADELTDRILNLAATLNLSHGDRKQLFAFALTLRRKRGIENFVSLAEHLTGIAIGDPQHFDADPMLLNVNNGTIDLRTGQLRAHAQCDLLTKVVPVDYDRNAQCERWLQFLDEVFDHDVELVQFIQRAIGYTLTGETREHAFFLLHGKGRNGKSTLVYVVDALLGDYGTSTPPDTFLNRKPGAPTNDLARLRGRRFVSSIETSERAALAESFVKAVTGGDKISARFLFAEYFDFEPLIKLWFSTNHKPNIKGVDEGIWRRVKLVPFSESFEGDREDPMLREKLLRELPGILGWAVRGCLEWQQHGLQEPAAVKAATASYRNEMDTLAAFIDDRCNVDSTAETPTTELYRSYKAWAEENGEKPLSNQMFGRLLAERGFESFRTTKRRSWKGLALRNNHACDEDDDELFAYGREILGNDA